MFVHHSVTQTDKRNTMSGNRFGAGESACPPQPWPAGLPPCPTQRIGLTDPLTPHAAHPMRFQQVQQQRTAQAVYNPNDAGGEASLASIAAQEQARRRLFVSSSQSCGDGLKHLLVTLDSSQADALRDAACDSGNTPGTKFNVQLETPMTEMLANRFVYGQVRSWEVALQRTCAEDSQRALAIVRAPVNNEPLANEENYTLPISEQFAVTPRRQALHLPLSGTRCPQVLLPLTLAHIERIVAFHWCRSASGARRLADEADDDLCPNGDCGALPLYAFRTSEEHGFAPGLRFALVLPSKLDNDPYEPDNADHFVVVDAGSSSAPGGGAAPWLDCREFVALRCKRVECAAREARVFDPWDLQGSECRKYGCEETAPRIEAPVPDDALAFLRRQDDAQRMRMNGNSVYWTLDADETDVCAFAYVSPATSPQRLAQLANGALRAQLYCGCDFFDNLGIQVRYEPTIDQFVATDGRGTRVQMRSLFGDECGASTTLNFPLRRSAMVVSECALDYKQLYLQRTLGGFYYFDVIEGVNDRFFVRREGEVACESACEWLAVVVPPACYPARFFALALQQALVAAVGDDAAFIVDYRVFDTDTLLAAREQFQREGGKSGLQALPTPRIGPYTNLTFAIIIEANSVFSLAFGADERSAAFANLIDYEPRDVYELRTMYASRALSLDCADERVQRDWLRLAQQKCAFDCSPCPRRKYEARVDEALGTVTLQQRIQRPYRVCKADKCGDAVRVRVAAAGALACDDAAVLFCNGDVLIASRTNPLGSAACCGDEVLVAIVGECSVHEFDLAHDPFPDASEFWLWAMPVGFNLHLHSNVPSNESTFNYFDSDKSSVPQQVAAVNAVTRFLGFRRPTTRSGSFCYTSDQVPASIIDETLLIRVPELLALATSESRDTLYTPQSPFDTAMTQYYAQFLLNRANGLYRASPALVAPLPDLSAPRDLLPAKGSSGVPCLQSVTVQLLRPDGSAYSTHGNPFVVTFELIYVRK